MKNKVSLEKCVKISQSSEEWKLLTTKMLTKSHQSWESKKKIKFSHKISSVQSKCEVLKEREFSKTRYRNMIFREIMWNSWKFTLTQTDNFLIKISWKHHLFPKSPQFVSICRYIKVCKLARFTICSPNPLSCKYMKIYKLATFTKYLFPKTPSVCKNMKAYKLGLQIC